MIKIQNKASKELNKIQKELIKVSKGKEPSVEFLWVNLIDIPDLVRYYMAVSSGKIKKAKSLACEMDTETRNLINDEIFEFIEDY